MARRIEEGLGKLLGKSKTITKQFNKFVEYAAHEPMWVNALPVNSTAAV